MSPPSFGYLARSRSTLTAAISLLLMDTPSAMAPPTRMLSTALSLPPVSRSASSVSAGRFSTLSSLIGVTASGARMRLAIARPRAAVVSGVSAS